MKRRRTRKPKPIKMTPRERRMGARLKRETEQRRRLERHRNDGLIVLLTHFIERHYGNPATGKFGAVMTGPVGARLSNAASLRALLIENEPVL